MGLVRLRHHSHHFATQSSHFVDRAGWHAKMASAEIWIRWRNAHGPPLKRTGIRIKRVAMVVGNITLATWCDVSPPNKVPQGFCWLQSQTSTIPTIINHSCLAFLSTVLYFPSHLCLFSHLYVVSHLYSFSNKSPSYPLHLIPFPPQPQSLAPISIHAAAPQLYRKVVLSFFETAHEDRQQVMKRKTLCATLVLISWSVNVVRRHKQYRQVLRCPFNHLLPHSKASPSFRPCPWCKACPQLPRLHPSWVHKLLWLHSRRLPKHSQPPLKCRSLSRSATQLKWYVNVLIDRFVCVHASMYCNPGNFSKLINLVNWRFWHFISYKFS